MTHEFAAAANTAVLPAVAPSTLDSRRNGRSTSPPVPASQDRIVVGGRQRVAIADDCLRVLKLANQPPAIFIRGGERVRVRRDERNAVLIERLSDAMLASRLGQIASFVSPSRPVKGAESSDEGAATTKPVYRAVALPLDVLRMILALGSWPFPGLLGVSESPVVRPDLSVWTTPGYDDVTRIYYARPAGIEVDVPDKPTDSQVADCLARLRTILEYPFRDEASFAGAMAFLLTPHLRHISGPAPMAVVSKKDRGLGGSLMSDVVARIATGRPAPVMAVPESDTELEKKIVSTLLAGDRLLVLDNARGRVSLAVLDAFLTADTWAGRVLGRSERVILPNLVTTSLNGNIVSLAGDLARRSYLIELESPSPRPWTRDLSQFTHQDLVGWVDANRGRLVSDILTLVRAFASAGSPSADVPVLGGFTRWTKLIGSMLAFLGIHGFLGNVSQLHDEADEETAEHEVLVRAIRSWSGTRCFTAAALYDAVFGDERTLKLSLPPELGDPDGPEGRGSLKRRLGQLLRRLSGTRFGEGTDVVWIERAGRESRTKVALWRVRVAVDQ